MTRIALTRGRASRATSLRGGYRDDDVAVSNARTGSSIWAWLAGIAAVIFIIAIIYGFTNRERRQRSTTCAAGEDGRHDGYGRGRRNDLRIGYDCSRPAPALALPQRLQQSHSYRTLQTGDPLGRVPLRRRRRDATRAITRLSNAPIHQKDAGDANAHADSASTPRRSPNNSQAIRAVTAGVR